MKTVFLSLVAMIIGMLVANAQTDMFSYVVTPSDTVFCRRINVNTSKTRVWIAGGESMKIANKDIVCYSDNGRIYQRLPVYKHGEKTDRSALMELVQCRNSVRVYKEERFNGLNESLDAYFYYYANGKCVAVDKNPKLDRIIAFVDSFDLKYLSLDKE